MAFEVDKTKQEYVPRQRSWIYPRQHDWLLGISWKTFPRTEFSRFYRPWGKLFRTN